jgi:hypothetical protein
MERKLRKHSKRLIEPAAMLFAVQHDAGERVRKQTMEGYGRLRDAHLLLAGVLGSALFRANGLKVELREGDMERTALLASFVIGMDLCERAIAEGRLIQACALVRQEMETATQMTALAEGRYRDGRTPNVAALEEDLRRIYGALTDAAHVSRHWIVRSATEYEGDAEDTSYTRHFPDFDRNASRGLFATHLVLMARMFGLYSAAKGDPVGDEDREAVRLAFDLMEAEGMVALQKDGD